MLTKKQEILYVAYVDEVYKLQDRALSLLLEYEKWISKTDDLDEIRRRAAASLDYREIVESMDLVHLDQVIESLETSVNVFMMEKLSENL
jgi:hypothetical protein